MKALKNTVAKLRPFQRSPEPVNDPATASDVAAPVREHSTRPIMRPVNHYTRYYVMALGLVALLSIYSFFEMREHLRGGYVLSNHVDDAIYQYALANRIMAAASAVTNATSRAEQQGAETVLRQAYAELVQYNLLVQEAVQNFDNLQKHRPLVLLDGLLNFLAPNSLPQQQLLSLQGIYFEPPYDLDFRLREIISLTEVFLATSDEAARTKLAGEINQLVQNDLAQGARLVALGLQEATAAELANAMMILRLYTVAALLALLAIGYLVFRPLFKRIVVTETELSHRIQAQATMLHKVEEAETRLRMALEGMQDGLWDWNLQTNEVFYSERWLAMLGYHVGELPNTLETWQSLLHPADTARAYQELEQHFADPANYPYQITLRYRHKNGSIRHVLARGKAVFDHTGRAVRMTGGHTDVTELTEIQESLRAQKLLLELFTQNAPVAVAMLDRQLRFLNVSSRWLQDYSLPETILGQPLLAVHQAFPVRWIEALREAIAGLTSESEEDSFERQKPDGTAETIFVRWRIQPWRDSQNFIGGVIVFSEITTEQVMLRRDAARASGLNQALAEFVSTELLYTGSEIEPSFEEICRFAQNALGLDRTSIWHIDDSGDFATAVRLLDRRNDRFTHGDRLERSDSFALFGRLSLNRAAVLHDCTAQNELMTPALAEHFDFVSINAALVVPVRVEQKIWGFLKLGTKEARQWQSHEIFFAQRLADLVAITITAHQRHALNTSLEKARAEAEAATVAKSRFVANMSHEVRTPLNGIIGVAEILSRTTLDQKQAELVNVLQNSCQHLLVLVTDILDFSKLEAGGVTLEKIAFQLPQIIRELLDLLLPRVKRENVEIVVHYNSRLPSSFVGDPTRLRQVLMNLLSNAIKFTNSGHIILSVDGQEQDNAEWLLRLSVTDTGIGIAAHNIPHLFGKFTQADSSTTRKYGGTGLGLAITKELVELMGGTVSVQSHEGAGSTFMIDLPLQPDRNAPRALPPAIFRGTSMLVFDDNQHSADAITAALRHLGISTQIFNDDDETIAAAELAALQKTPFASALIDVDANPDRALVLARSFKSHPTLANISLVALRRADTPSEDDLLQQGFVATLKKPVLPYDLTGVMQGVLEARRSGNMSTLLASSRSANSSSHNVGHTTGSQGILNPLQQRKVLLAEDNETNRLIVSHFLTELGCKTVIAMNGEEAVAAFKADPSMSAILMDCQMPVLDGFAATAAIRALPQGQNVPIIALTANAQEGDREFCLRAGMNDYLAKPLRLETLRTHLLNLLDPKQQSNQEGATKNAGPLLPALPAEPLDHKNLAAAFDHNTAVIDRILASFSATAVQLLQQADACLQTQDMTALAKTAHTLKGSCLSVYAGPMAEDSKKLEQAALQNNTLECGFLLNLLRRHLNHIASTTTS